MTFTAADFSFFAYYQYEDSPRVFLKLPDLTDTQVVSILAWFDEMYGNTDQETTDWALEYQILARNLLSTQRALLVNPRYLALEEVEDELLNLLSDTQKEAYRAALALSKKKLYQLYQESEGVVYKFEEGDEVSYQGHKGIVSMLLKDNRYLVYFEEGLGAWSEEVAEADLS